MKKLLFIIAMLSMALSSLGHYTPTAVRYVADGSHTVIDNSACSHEEMVKNLATRYAPQREEEVLYNVEPVFTFDEEKGIKPWDFQYAISEDGSEVYVRYFLWEWNDLVIPWYLPEGTYDFVFVYTSHEGLLVETKEGVSINGDREIDSNAANAFVNHIEWQPVLPNGSTPLEDPDNGDLAYGCTFIGHKKLDNILALSMFDFIKYDVDGVVHDKANEFDVWTNASDQFVFGQTVSAKKGNDQYYINMPAIGVKSQIISNKENGFNLSYSLNAPNDWNDIIGKEEPATYPYVDWQFRWDDNFVMGYGTIWNIDQKDYVKSCYYSETEKYDAYKVTILPIIKIVAHHGFYEEDGPEGTYGIQFPALNFSETDMDYTFIRVFGSNFDSQNGAYAYNENGLRLSVVNPDFAIPQGMNPVFGAEVPFVMFSRPDAFFGYSYLGRYSELRTLDYLNQDFSIRLDGKEVWDNYLNMDSFYYDMDNDWAPGIGFEKGVWEYEINSKNVVVDGLQGTTHCLMQFTDSEAGTWPTVSALQFRNSNGDITDRFTDGSDGIMMFTGGEWSRVDWGFDCVLPQEVTVEYAPYGSEDFLPLECVNVPEKRFMPGYGEYFEVSLDGVTAESESGWYGVRLTMTDSNGNTQSQTITPAFRIGGTDGVAFVNGRINGVTVSGHEIIAPEGTQIYSLDGKRVGQHDLSSGVYVVKTSDKTMKVIVR